MHWRDGGTAFIVFFIWDWLATAGTRLVVDLSYWALPLAAATTLLWIYGTKLVVERPGIIPYILAGVIAGTLAGIKVP